MSRPLRIAVGLVATVGWMACLTSLHGTDLFFRLGLYSLAVVVAVSVVDGRRTRSLLRLRRDAILMGLLAGLLMAALTHFGYWALAPLVPPLRSTVQALSASFAHNLGARGSLLWLLTIVMAEDLLWRGLWPAVFEDTRASLETVQRPWLGGGIAVLVYAVGQAGSGSWAVVALALGCGAIWTGLRLWTRSLWTPLLAHALWDLIVLVWFPLES